MNAFVSRLREIPEQRLSGPAPIVVNPIQATVTDQLRTAVGIGGGASRFLLEPLYDDRHANILCDDSADGLSDCLGESCW